MATSYQHGSLGTAYVGGQALCVSSWDCTIENALAETTTTCSNGWREYIKGLGSATGTISGKWDLLANPAQSPYNLQAGTLVSPLKLNISSTSYFQFNAYLSNIKTNLDVNDVITWSADFQSSGSVSYPT